jgi:hypothetical protein
MAPPASAGSLAPSEKRGSRADGVEPEVVLRGFIADLAGIVSWQANPRAGGYSSNGSDERRYAMEYYERVGYPWWRGG